MPFGHWQYLSHAEPLVSRRATTAYVPPLTVDRPRSPAVVALTVAACFFVPAPAAPQTPQGWNLAPLSEPTRAIERRQYETGAERPLEVPQSQHLTWYQPLSEPTRLRYVQTPELSPFVRLQAQPKGLEWWTPLSEPVRLAPFQPRPIWDYFFGIANTAVPSFGWYEPLSEPVRTKQPNTHSPSAMFVQIPPAAAVVPFGWYVRMPDLVWGKTMHPSRMPFWVSDPRWLPPTPPTPAYYTEEVFMRRLRRSPHVSAEDTWVFYRRFQIDLDTGIGLDGAECADGANPQVMLRWSDDDGETWSNEQWVSAGRIGEYDARAEWRRLGRGRDRVFEVVVSDPVAWMIVAAYLDLEKGTS